MMGLNEIKRMNKEAEEKAKKHTIKPYIAKKDNDDGVKKAPFIGDYIPRGWTRVAEYFVDSSGFGTAGEPALTFGQFLAKVKKGRAYALIECGQFQVWIAEYKKET